MATDVEANITGKIWHIKVDVGDEVEEGDELIIFSSMKMEIPLEAEVSGTVSEILVEEGDRDNNVEGEPVDEGDVVMRIEE
jgi:acetyl-CoA carboxylase biotin carboxyl carrier protein